MAEPEWDGREQAREHPLTTLTRVPIVPAHLALMTRVLTEHGATLTEAEDTVPGTIDPTASMYTVTFPPGTVRVDGIMIHRTFPFVIYFPDKYFLHGARLYPITLRRDDPYIHGLFPDRLEMTNKEQPGEEVRSIIHRASDE
jgi:hypothetical protein